MVGVNVADDVKVAEGVSVTDTVAETVADAVTDDVCVDVSVLEAVLDLVAEAVAVTDKVVEIVTVEDMEAVHEGVIVTLVLLL